MRGLLGFSVLLLVLVVLLNRYARELERTPVEHVAGESTRILAFSTGNRLPPATYRGEPRTEGLFVADRVSSVDAAQYGLRVVGMRENGTVEDHGNFDFGGDDGARERFARLCAAQPVNTLFVMAAHGALRPPGKPDWDAGPLEATFTALGARARPFLDEAASWALITLRRPAGWVPLAEGYSRRRGLLLAFQVRPDPASYDGFHGSFEHDVTGSEAHAPPGPERLRGVVQSDGRTVVRLVEQLPFAARTTTCVATVETIGGTSLEAILAHPPWIETTSEARANRRAYLGFPALALGEAPRFLTSLGLRPDMWQRTDGVTFIIRVDGQTLGEQSLPDGREPAWVPWEVDLSRFAGRTVQLELEVDPGGNTAFDAALWGSPRVVSGPTPSEPATAGEPRRIVFVGHAYPFNGFDKRRYEQYLGWDTSTEPPVASGRRSIADRLERERRDAAGFAAAIDAVRADRLVWGGDSVYGVNPASVAHFRAVVQWLARTPQVLLPGNHDRRMLDAIGGGLFLHPPGTSETIAGVRILYLDTTGADPIRADPDADWRRGLVDAVREPTSAFCLLLLQHHAPWFTEPDSVKFAEEADWWKDEIHPVLAEAAGERGLSVWVLSGDGGDGFLADGRMRDGVHYVVTGQPRFDDDVGNGFVELRWWEGDDDLTLVLHRWSASAFVPRSWPWRE